MGADAISLLFMEENQYAKREKVRLRNRSKNDINVEIAMTGKALAAFIVAYYASFYIIAVVLSLALGKDIDGKEPFNTDDCGWDSDGDKVGLLSLLITWTFMIIPATLIVKEGDSWKEEGVVSRHAIHDRVWDFAVTTGLLHIIISSIVVPPSNWKWWVTILCSILILSVVGGPASRKYWTLEAQKRINSSMDACNGPVKS